MGRIIHLEFTTPDVAAATRFFTEAFGWSGSQSPYVPDYVMTDTGSGHGIDGAIMSRSYQPQPVIAWIAVADIHRSLDAVLAHGGEVAGDVNEVPGVGYVSYFKDPDGTVWGLRQGFEQQT